MRKLKLIVGIVFFAIAANSYAQKTYLQPDEIPQELQTYVKTHFPNNEMVYGKKKVKTNRTEYEVQLKSDDVEIEFNQDYQVTEIESDTPLPKSVVPEKIWNYVIAHYPNNHILEWKLKRSSQKVELDNDLDLYFDRNGEFQQAKD